MQLHLSPSLRSVTVSPSKGVKEFVKVKLGSKRVSYRMFFYAILFFTFLLRFVFVLIAVDTIDGENECSSLGCMGKRLKPTISQSRIESNVPQVMYQVFEEQIEASYGQGGSQLPQSLEAFVTDMKKNRPDAKTFALKLKAMVALLEQKTRTARIQEYLYHHVASSSIPKQLHCLALRLANEHSSSSAARSQLPSPELISALVDNFYFHYVLALDNILAASVVANSLVHNSLRPQKVVLHIITDKKTYSSTHAWFSLHSLEPAVIEVKALHCFDWFSKGKVPVLEALEKERRIRAQFRGGSSAIVANESKKPNVMAAKLQALSPKYNSLMNHLRIHLAENLKSDLSLWQLGTLPPGLIAFHGYVHTIDPFWHMLGLGYRDNASFENVKNAGVIHFNGRANHG